MPECCTQMNTYSSVKAAGQRTTKLITDTTYDSSIILKRANYIHTVSISLPTFSEKRFLVQTVYFQCCVPTTRPAAMLPFKTGHLKYRDVVDASPAIFFYFLQIYNLLYKLSDNQIC
jgi:hypothetical protein